MGRFQVLIYSGFICFFLNGCCIPVLQKKFYTTEYGSNRPKKNKFKLSKEENISRETFFDENYIYTYVDSVYGKNPKTGVTKLSIYKSFKRFFKTGHYIQGSIKDSNFSLKDYNNLKSGTIGYYKIQNSKIIYEYFLVTAHNCGDYYTAESKIIGDSIVGYEKHEVEGLTGTPDW